MALRIWLLKPKCVAKGLQGIYTTSAKQNEMLRAGKAIIEAIQTASKFVTVYPYNIGKATSNLIQYDLRKGEYYVNVSGRTF